jgi:hypothetical protein
MFLKRGGYLFVLPNSLRLKIMGLILPKHRLNNLEDEALARSRLKAEMNLL